MYSKGGFCFDLFQFILGLREFREDVILRLLSAYLELWPARILRNGIYISTYYNSDLHEDSYKILKKLSKVIQIHSFFQFFFWVIPIHIYYNSAPSGAWDCSLKCIYPFFRCMLAKILSNDYMQYLKCTFWSRLLNIK